MDKVPQASRATAEKISMVAPVAQHEQPSWLGPVRIEWESFAAGFATAFLLGVIFLVGRRTKKPMIEFGVLVAVAAVIAVVYFGWVKQRPAPPATKQGAQPAQVDDSNKINEKIIKTLMR
jgi:uncharacterized membrane protein YebE (DUF533 family)